MSHDETAVGRPEHAGTAAAAAAAISLALLRTCACSCCPPGSHGNDSSGLLLAGGSSCRALFRQVRLHTLRPRAFVRFGAGTPSYAPMPYVSKPCSSTACEHDQAITVRQPLHSRRNSSEAAATQEDCNVAALGAHQISISVRLVLRVERSNAGAPPEWGCGGRGA